jgi:hypothetical protein
MRWLFCLALAAAGGTPAPASFVGSYTSHQQSVPMTAKVTLTGDSLILAVTGEPAHRLLPISATLFEIDGGHPLGARAEFVVTGGKVVALVLDYVKDAVRLERD